MSGRVIRGGLVVRHGMASGGVGVGGGKITHYVWWTHYRLEYVNDRSPGFCLVFLATTIYNAGIFLLQDIVIENWHSTPYNFSLSVGPWSISYFHEIMENFVRLTIFI